MSKKRLDEILVERNLIENSDKAKRIIMAGLVFSEQQRLDKPGMKVDENISLTVKGKSNPYVGRGGFKLEKALKTFNISAEGKILIDVGSSTGGFTDCALQNGAMLSYAIDVGYNQLDWKLRNDARVVVMERTNFRYVTADMLKKGTPNFASVDVSFISIKKILPVLNQLLAANSDVVVLIKPQFEAKKEQVGEKGIVNDKYVHEEVLREIIAFANKEQYELINLTFSPITGGEGNIEFLAHFGWKTGINNGDEVIDQIENIVKGAHYLLK
ncbi:TlyA family RNA methyltransferase [Oceanobacillus chungangensis]|uniref:TlyA family rRNA (Cytidine-2'-O)-methyltransferase n=1 Tax=Oceanobacillus chungangensis TaxID=1229152 RepID=A0A3D8Q0J1_9BACI|nr:TlyA family RNA methyltransferase [Oceanobacillus chungangensis]RDW21970.1 TlyA family rRNA (cytidine-2'-O)-methyltransferase [Oceanobacillus chungangensis]